jgi:hypothetical protein
LKRLWLSILVNFFLLLTGNIRESVPQSERICSKGIYVTRVCRAQEKTLLTPIVTSARFSEIDRVRHGRRDPPKAIEVTKDSAIHLHVRVKVPVKEHPRVSS